ncbi:hypothetical protein ACOMHN_034694 [Nucella lapillus]
MGTASSPYPTFQPWVQPAVLTPPSNHGYSQQSLPHLPTMGTASSPYPTFQPWVQPAVLTPPSNHGYSQQSLPHLPTMGTTSSPTPPSNHGYSQQCTGGHAQESPPPRAINQRCLVPGT